MSCREVRCRLALGILECMLSTVSDDLRRQDCVNATISLFNNERMSTQHPSFLSPMRSISVRQNISYIYYSNFLDPESRDFSDRR